MRQKFFTKNKNNVLPSPQSGYAVLELLFYIALFAVLTLVVINAMITMAKSFRETATYTEFVQSGNMMERMSREIRGAYAISSIGASDLVLNTIDEEDAEKTVEFLLSAGNLQLLENGVLTGNLNAPNIVVTGLTFTEITTAEGKGVKIVLTIESNNDLMDRSVDFYNTIVLRGVY